MSNLISAVADMTGQRDRDLLEVTVAEVLFSLLDARRLSLWKVIEHPQGARVRLMAGLSRGQAVAMSDPAVEPEMLPLVDKDRAPKSLGSKIPRAMSDWSRASLRKRTVPALRVALSGSFVATEPVAVW